MAKKITIADIAADAGVSLATVSRVLNQKGLVTSATYSRVMTSAKKLGYELADPDAPPAGDGILIFNVPSIDNPFYSEILKGLRVSALGHGHQLLIYEGELTQTTLPELQSILRKTKATGVISTNQIETAVLNKLSELVPVVQCSEYNDQADLPYVTINDEAASAQVVEYLLSLGRRRIAIINGPENYKYARHRLRGYAAGLEKGGVEFDPALVVNLPDVNYELAMAAAIQLINSQASPDAFFACSDVFAMAVIRAACLTGHRVPDDFAVVGFDNIVSAGMSVPSLTTVNLPKYQLGFTACELLFERLENPDGPVKKLTFETELIIRESTGPGRSPA